MPSLAPLYGRAGGAADPRAAARLPAASSPAARARDLPSERLRVEAVAAERDDGRRATAASAASRCATRFRPTYPHVLAFPLHMALMSRRLVPVRRCSASSTSRTRSPSTGRSAIGEALDFERRRHRPAPAPEGHRLHAARPRPAPAASSSGRSAATILRRGGRRARTPSASRHRSSAPADVPASAEWRLGGDLGRRYAAVSGDRNPIHMHPLTARAIRVPAADRARDVEQGALPRASSRAGCPDAFAVDVSLPQADPAAGPGPVRRRAAGGWQDRVCAPRAGAGRPAAPPRRRARPARPGLIRAGSGGDRNFSASVALASLQNVNTCSGHAGAGDRRLGKTG